MKKIPTIFERDWDNDPSRVTQQPHPDCGWVFSGEGVATHKYDGTCVMYDGTRWWARRDTKEGKLVPDGWFATGELDPETGKTPGYEPIELSPFAKYHAEAVTTRAEKRWEEGTYELIGPKIQKNPEGASKHTLIWHNAAETLGLRLQDRTYEGIKEFLSGIDVEGIVFRHADGRMGKIKKRDYGLRR